MHLTHYALAALSAGVAGIQAGVSPPGGPPMAMQPGEPALPTVEIDMPKLKSRSDVSKPKGGADLFKRDSCGYAKVVNKCQTLGHSHKSI